MKHVGSTLLIAAVAMLALPSAAEACACCDGGNTRDLVGWSGDTALVRQRGLACEDTLSFEIMRAGRPEPVGCFDAYGETPSRRTACSENETGYDRFDEGETRPTTTPRASEYASVPMQLAATHVHATLETGPATDRGAPLSTLRVFLWVDASWRPIYERSLHLGHPDYESFDGDVPEALTEEQQVGELANQNVQVRVWPAPSGRRALVEVSGHDDSPGTGHFPEEMAWVSLPASSLSLPRVLRDAEAAVVAVPVMSVASVDLVTRQTARRANALGLRYHNQRDYIRAASWFIQALMVNPAHVVARYNLACALARQSRIEPAFEVLQVIQHSDCPRCEERMNRARVDEDLRALHSRLVATP